MFLVELRWNYGNNRLHVRLICFIENVFSLSTPLTSRSARHVETKENLFCFSPHCRILACCCFYFPTTMVLMYCYGSAFHVNKLRLKRVVCVNTPEVVSGGHVERVSQVCQHSNIPNRQAQFKRNSAVKQNRDGPLNDSPDCSMLNRTRYLMKWLYTRQLVLPTNLNNMLCLPARRNETTACFNKNVNVIPLRKREVFFL